MSFDPYKPRDPSQPITRQNVWDNLTEYNARKPFEEYPKHLYHPDGRTQIVESAAQEAGLGAEWFPTPQEAIDEKTRRDERSSEEFISKVNAEAAAEQSAKDELFAIVLGDPAGAAAKAYPLIDTTGKSSVQILAELKDAVAAAESKTQARRGKAA